MRILQVIGRSIIDFFRDDGLMFAASMSYFTMMAIVPFCLFVITLFGYLLGHYPEFYRYFLGRLMNLFPEATREMTQDISKIIVYHGIGKVGIVLYGLLSFQVYASYESALKAIFKVKQKRSFIASLFISLTVVTLILALLMISFSAASLIPLLKVLSPLLPGVKLGSVTQFIIRFVLPFFLVLFIVTMMYIIIPKTRVRFFDAFQGALFTTLFLEVAKHLFTWYVRSVVELGKIYGPLTAFISFLLWVYFSSSIFLIGAEIVHHAGISGKGRGVT